MGKSWEHMGKSWEHMGNSPIDGDVHGKLIENHRTKWGF